MPDFTGLSLDRGRYRLLENIGCGAYGKVYHARDVSYRSSKTQALAIKCLRKPTDPRSCLSQKRELEHHKLVSEHPNIITFHRCFSDEQFVYVVLDFCDGGDLFFAITEKRLFHENECLTKSAFVQLIDAVAHCHRLGVFHRDIKPENILCSDDGSDIRLTDFGLSIMSPYSENFVCGSSGYMSPECIGKQVYCREYATSYNDIWALGVILTNMITVRSPWKDASMRDDCFAAYLMDNDFLKKTLPISEGVNDILKGIFIVNPARRFTLAKMRSRILTLEALWDFENENEQDVSAFKAGSLELRSGIIICDTEADASLVVTDAFKTAGCLTVPLSDSSSSSAPESNGPITPTTRAVDVGPIVDIPDISTQDIVATSSVKARRPADIFRAAFRGIKSWYDRSSGMQAVSPNSEQSLRWSLANDSVALCR